MADLLLIFILIFALLGIFSFVAAILLIGRRRFIGGLAGVLLAAILLCVSGLCAAISIGIQGYRAFTHEEVAAVVRIEPLARQTFVAYFRFPNGREATYILAGDQLYVDASILKWKPVANFLGLHTAYELDRVGGRYNRIEDEREKPRTVYLLSGQKLLDMVRLRQRYVFFRPLLDVEYGSATFAPADRPGKLEIRVSTSGLLMRPVTSG